VSLRRNPGVALALLTALNFFNYIDRYVLPAVQPLVQKELHRNDADMGWLTSVFFLFYMCVAPFMGVLADRYSRKMLIVIGAILWSGATLLTAVTTDYTSLLIRHTLVGIGEASFVTIAPSFIADLYPEQRRGRMLAIFYLAIPMGTAMGYLLGGHLGPIYGWRAPFMVAAVPGFLIAAAIAFLAEPTRGHVDSLTVTPERATVLGLLRNGAFLTATLGMAMMTFALGGLSVWMPTFLSRVRGLTLNDANVLFGSSVLVSGFIATIIGGWLGDYLLRKRRSAYYLVSAVGMALALPFMVLAIYHQGRLMFPAIFLALFFLLLNTGPLNAAIINSVSSPIRATAIAINIFVIHILGDVPSPRLIGYISDKTGSLPQAFISTVIAVAISAIVLFYGSRYAPQIRQDILDRDAAGASA
jgi:MFS transporter, Spinster family, sphingosine-1-phosphate transporter